MKNNYTVLFLRKVLVLLVFTLTICGLSAQESLRRPISSNQPMWLVHIDTWNYADPQKIIDLIPEDIRPFVVMNISISISHDVETSRFKVAEYGYEIAKSWVRTCAQNRMWAMVQMSSGGFAQFSDTDLSVYHEFFQEYPNFIGFNYAEQFWGFDDSNDPLSPSWSTRINHFANLLKVCNQYGGYLTVSWCGNQWSAGINPIAMLKRNPVFADACETYTENFILCEKYTQQSFQSDMESICLGAYLSGYSGNYGIRYDDTGWTDPSGNHDNYILATGGAPHLEHAMLTGQTVIDGPELIWTMCFREKWGTQPSTNGYKMLEWETFPQFDNFSIDLFRKIIDGTVRIPSRQEVIDRTKVVVINDVNSGSGDDIYSTPETLFEGLYRMDGDGNYENNKSFFKKTGRYPTIPTVFDLSDDLANSFEIKVNKSEYSNKWPSIQSKVDEFNTLFDEEYTGDLYAGRHENGWVTYNPYKTGQNATASIPFKYNTCEKVDLEYTQYTSGVMKEYADKVTFYLTNFDEKNQSTLKTNVIKIYGSTSEPTYSYTDRADHIASVLSKDWSDGVFTLTVEHNGPLDITINCQGTASGRLTSYTEANIIEPNKPAIYTGPLQYEAECFDYKSIVGTTNGGYDAPIRNYTGQGYLTFGTSSNASVRDTVTVIRDGQYQLLTRYSTSGSDVNTIDLYVNGSKVATPLFAGTSNTSVWKLNTQLVSLNAGKNVIEFTANATGKDIVFDNIVVTQGQEGNIYNFSADAATTAASSPAAQLITVQSGSAGVVAYTDANNKTSNCFKTYSVGAANGSGVADLEMFHSDAKDYTIIWKEYYGTVGGKKGVLLRGTGENGSCAYAEGMKKGYMFISQNNDDNTVTLKPYVANSTGLLSQSTYTSSFSVSPEQPCWFRATASGNMLVFECSNDSLNWEGATETLFVDDSYDSGSTQIVWGLNSNNFSWVMDDIAYYSSSISVSTVALGDFSYQQSAGPSDSQMFTVSGRSLLSNILIQAPDNFEVSLEETTGYSSGVEILAENGIVKETTVYVRLKDGLAINQYNGDVTIGSEMVKDAVVNVHGRVLPMPNSRIYNFSRDEATTSAQTPPSWKTSIGQDNAATAGVVSYTDANEHTSNVLTPYSTGQKNATGIINLDLFSATSTDYSITWKQYIGSNEYYKVGTLMRGDVNNVGDATNGYVQGIMNGYLFIVYSAGPENRSEFRIYRSTAGGLNMMTNGQVGNLSPAIGQSVWYRSSVSGSATVELTFEYSTDGVSWVTAATASEASVSAFQFGASQIVWGLAADNTDFYLDDITFNGLESENGSPDLISISTSELSGFLYNTNNESNVQSFSVTGNSLTDDVSITAPIGYELSLDENQPYSSEVIILHQDGNIAETPVYVRLTTGLSVGSYNGNVNLSSIGVLTKKIALSGEVTDDVGIDDLPMASKILISIEHYSLTGERINDIDNRTGFFIERRIYSDKSISTKKIVKLNK